MRLAIVMASWRAHRRSIGRSIPYLDRQTSLHNRGHFRIRAPEWREDSVKPVLRDQHVVQGEIIDTRAQETCERIGGRFHDGFALYVERRVEQDGNPGDRVEFLEQLIK